MRLLDHIFLEGVTPPDAITTEGVRTLCVYAANATVVIADNVTSYYYEGSDQEDWLWDKDFPNLAPPFRDMWIETGRPSKIVSEENGVVSSLGLVEKWGALLQTAIVTKPEEIDEFIAKLQKYARDTPDTKSAMTAWKQGEVRWIISAYLFAWMGAEGPVGPTCVSMFPVKADGSIVMSESGKPAILTHAFLSETLVKAIKADPQVLHNYLNESVNYLKPLMLAVCFMNCSNVSLDDYQHPRHERRQLARAGSKTGQIQYKVLKIEPMRKVAKQAAADAGVVGSKKALHLCRGHFSDYRKSGLFGKYKGIYWWDAHVRGSVEVGVVEKQYEVVASSNGV